VTEDLAAQFAGGGGVVEMHSDGRQHGVAQRMYERHPATASTLGSRRAHEGGVQPAPCWPSSGLVAMSPSRRTWWSQGGALSRPIEATIQGTDQKSRG
jgi:hypothetical protein